MSNSLNGEKVPQFVTNMPVCESKAVMAKWEEEHSIRQATRQDMVTRAMRLALTANDGGYDPMSTRTAMFKFLLDGNRDIDNECGYAPWLTPQHYKAMYDREGVAKRVVNCYPEETWAMEPTLSDGPDNEASKTTAFGQAWTDLLALHDIWSVLEQADTVSGIGQFGILLLGFNDGGKLSQPVPGCHEDGTWDEGLDHKLMYTRVFADSSAFIRSRVNDNSNPRNGQAYMYRLQYRDNPSWGMQASEVTTEDVHWSRVIHLADNRLESVLFGEPRMKPVWNRLYDLRKIYGGSGEAYWRGGFPGLSFEVHPDLANADTEIDEVNLKKQMEAYASGQSRMFAVSGVTAKSLPSNIADPTKAAENALKAVAIGMSVPLRVLFGSEEAKLAGTQDSRAWNKRLHKRQHRYVTPYVVRPLVDRLCNVGALPKPAQSIIVSWPDLNLPTEQDKAGVALTKTQALQTYVAGNVHALIPPEVFFAEIIQFPPDVTERIMQSILKGGGSMGVVSDRIAAIEEQMGGLGANDSSLASDQSNLSGSTTGGNDGRTVAAQLVSLPSVEG